MQDAIGNALRHRVESAIDEYAKAQLASPYGRIGGGPAVRALVDRLYGLVLADPDLARYFIGVPMHRLKQHQAALLAELLGGPKGYYGRDLAAAHKRLHICRCQYRRAGGYLRLAMSELELPDDVIRSVMAIVAGVENQIVGAGRWQRLVCWVGRHKATMSAGSGVA